MATAQGLILVQNFLLQMEAWEKNFIAFGAGMSSSVHIDNKNKGILILAEEPTRGLDDTHIKSRSKISY